MADGQRLTRAGLTVAEIAELISLQLDNPPPLIESLLAEVKAIELPESHSPLRVLITGHRTWPNLAEPMTVLHGLAKSYGPLHVVHGAHNKGIDNIVDRYLTRYGAKLGWTVERHPANWRLYDKAAGPRRNQEMVDLGADICVGFPGYGSAGTPDCMTRAFKASIPTYVVSYAVRGLERDLLELTVFLKNGKWWRE